MKQENGYYIDNNNNRWSMFFYTEERATQFSSSLTNCTDCTDCRDCTDCTDCTDCRDCTDCTNCRNCSICTNCRDCTDCTDCRYCTDCTDCRYCTDCTDFEENPQRYITAKIGSRNDQTSFYWVGQMMQVACGCFRGDLQEFEARVEDVYGKADDPVPAGENTYYKQYMNEIRKVKFLM